MSTQQILGVVGGAVGLFFGYPQLGFVVGSLVGGLLTPGEKSEGPRVDDLKVQVSTYGVGIPILYGTERVGGNVIWSTDKLEVSDTQGGKGGAPENTTYRYFVHMSIALCETPRDGSEISIVQIYQDGKLIFDVRSGVPIASALASAENLYARFILYQGHADQLPDPSEEGWLGGPGSAPAYRGIVRMHMDAIECPGGRVPQFSFVITNTPSISTKTLYTTINDASGIASSNGVWGFNTVVDLVSANVAVWWGGPGQTAERVKTVSLGNPYNNFGAAFAVQGSTDPEVIYSINLIEGGTPTNYVRSLNLDSGLTATLYEEPFNANPMIGYGTKPRAAYDSVTERYCVTLGFSNASLGLVLLPNRVDCSTTGMDYLSPLAFNDGVIYVLNYASGQLNISRINGENGNHIDIVIGPSVPNVSLEDCSIQVDAGGCIVRAHTETAGAPIYSVFFSGSTGAWVLLCADSNYLGSRAPETANSSSSRFLASGAIVGPNISGIWTWVQYKAYNPVPVSVSEIVSDLCDRVGETRYDVSAIPSTDKIWGYKLQNPASARAKIDPLLTGFAAYIVDEDGAIRFKKLEGIASVASIGYDELGQAEDGSEASDPMPLTRAQEVDLPRSVSVSYIDPTFDYQTAAEKEVRQITSATEDVVIELPLATSSDHAKKVASMMLFAKWRAQNVRSFKTSRKFAFLSPGDGVTVEYPRGISRLWRITSVTDTGALCEFNVEPGDAELYTQTAIGATGYEEQVVAALPPPTRLQLLDIPILRDTDNNAGLYAAMAGFGSGWSGAELFVGDDAVTLESRGTVSNEATIGFSENSLGSWNSGIVDESNLLTVNVGHQTLGSITYAQLLAGSLNVAAVGAPGRWEIIKFRTANSLGGGRYVLSGLRRGMRGTEWARGTHVANDTFVILGLAGTLRPNFDAGSIGQTKSYRAVSRGLSSSNASIQTYANTAEGLETFSPANISRSGAVGSDITLVCVRRTRLTENWLRGIVPLGEEAQLFEFELYTSSAFTTLRRVITSSTRTAIYTTAMQAADGYTTGQLFIRVYQLSGVVGRGHVLQATL